MVDLWRDFWIRETGTDQQVAQLHERYMRMMMMMMMILWNVYDLRKLRSILFRHRHQSENQTTDSHARQLATSQSTSVPPQQNFHKFAIMSHPAHFISVTFVWPRLNSDHPPCYVQLLTARKNIFTLRCPPPPTYCNIHTNVRTNQSSGSRVSNYSKTSNLLEITKFREKTWLR